MVSLRAGVEGHTPGPLMPETNPFRETSPMPLPKDVFLRTLVFLPILLCWVAACLLFLKYRRVIRRHSVISASVFAFVALAVALASGVRYDYIRYLEEWGYVVRGEDPWIKVEGRPTLQDVFSKSVTRTPNAYGPLFNMLAL